jgi:hypothetical protein
MVGRLGGKRLERVGGSAAVALLVFLLGLLSVVDVDGDITTTNLPSVCFAATASKAPVAEARKRRARRASKLRRSVRLLRRTCARISSTKSSIHRPCLLPIRGP